MEGNVSNDLDDMPVFVIKAQDALAAPVISYYASLCESRGLRDQEIEVLDALEEVVVWQRANPERVKLPDHKHVPRRSLRCPACDSPEPRLHPAVQAGGEVSRICPDVWHQST